MQHVGGPGEVEGFFVSDVQQVFFLVLVLVLVLPVLVLDLLLLRPGLEFLVLFLVNDLVALAADVADDLLDLSLGLVNIHMLSRGVGLEAFLELSPVGLGVVVNRDAEGVHEGEE